MWVPVKHCPGCHGSRSADRGFLAGERYIFESMRIPYPVGGIRLLECIECGLVFKDIVPSRAYLGDVLCAHHQDIWQKNPPYLAERRAIEQYADSERMDVLDIGAGTGGFLESLKDINGRRSALDIVEFPGVAHAATGEFIHAMVDDENIVWSGDAYDVVTMFDVAEHLYAPTAAFANLRRFVRQGGIVLIETGDILGSWPRSYGVHNWWYARLFEHHLFWSERSLTAIAAMNGFEIVRTVHKRHKGRAMQGWLRTVLDTTGVFLYTINDRLYQNVAGMMGRCSTQPWSPLAKDHIQMILRRR